MDESDGVTRCICGFTHPDEFMICCDRCEVWQHNACMGLDNKKLPEEYLCERCLPRKGLNPRRAREVQRAKVDSEDEEEQEGGYRACVHNIFVGKCEPHWADRTGGEGASRVDGDSEGGVLLPAAVKLSTLSPRRKNPLPHEKHCLVATRSIPEDTPVALFRGRCGRLKPFLAQLPPDESIMRKAYPHVWFDMDRDLYVDARKMGTVARFVRRSCSPNAALRHCRAGPTREVALVTTEAVEAGAEVTVAFDFAHQLVTFPVVCACTRGAECPVRSKGKTAATAAAPAPASAPATPTPKKAKPASSRSTSKMTREERKIAAIMKQFAAIEPTASAPATLTPQTKTPRRRESTSDRAKTPRAKPEPSPAAAATAAAPGFVPWDPRPRGPVRRLVPHTPFTAHHRACSAVAGSFTAEQKAALQKWSELRKLERKNAGARIKPPPGAVPPPAADLTPLKEAVLVDWRRQPQCPPPPKLMLAAAIVAEAIASPRKPEHPSPEPVSPPPSYVPPGKPEAAWEPGDGDGDAAPPALPSPPKEKRRMSVQDYIKQRKEKEKEEGRKRQRSPSPGPAADAAAKVPRTDGPTAAAWAEWRLALAVSDDECDDATFRDRYMPRWAVAPQI